MLLSVLQRAEPYQTPPDSNQAHQTLVCEPGTYSESGLIKEMHLALSLELIEDVVGRDINFTMTFSACPLFGLSRLHVHMHGVTFS